MSNRRVSIYWHPENKNPGKYTERTESG